MKYSPILLFVYNRPDHTKRLISSLQNNILANESQLIIYSDGAKTYEEEKSVNEVRQFINTINGFSNVTIIERKENQGLAHNIIDGVTTQIKQYGRVIVLEDDLIVAPYFLQFMNDALDLYKDESRIGHIHGCNFVSGPNLPDSFLIKWAGSWGWATWERAWQYFNPDGKTLLHELQNHKHESTFNFNGKYNYVRMLKKQIAGKNNSWAIRWYASLFTNNILSLNASKSLVLNKGFDGSGTNCGAGDLYDTNIYMDPLNLEIITPIEESKIARKAFEQYYQETNSFKAKAIRRIKRTIKGDFGK